jgi:hypothetical protein
MGASIRQRGPGDAMPRGDMRPAAAAGMPRGEMGPPTGGSMPRGAMRAEATVSMPGGRMAPAYRGAEAGMPGGDMRGHEAGEGWNMDVVKQPPCGCS